MNKKKIISSPIFVFIVALFCASMWGSSFPIIKYGFKVLNIQNDTAGKLYFASYRFFIAGLMMFLIVKISEGSIFLSEKKDYLYLAIIGISQTSLLYTFFYIGLSNTTGIKAAIITASGSLFLAISSHFLFKNDSLTYRKIIGLFLGFIGIILINIKAATENITLIYDFKLTGEIFIMFGALASTCGNIMVKYIVVRVHPPLMCAYQFTIGSLILFFISLSIGTPATFDISIEAISLIIILSIISATAFSLWYFLIKYNPLSSIAIYRFLIPICGTFFSIFFIKDENFNFSVFISLLLVCSGIILTSKQKC